MSLSPISFTAKIPTARCKIYDKSQDKFVGATLYEYDCKDASDRKEIRALEGRWAYKDVIADGISRKYNNYLKGERQYSRFFNLTSDNGDILGICYTDEFAREMNVNFISKRQDDKNYKMIGQAMMACLGELVLNSSNYKLIIKSAISDAWDFYEKTCGFRPIDEDKCPDLEMNRVDILRFVRRTEEKTNGQIKVL